MQRSITLLPVILLLLLQSCTKDELTLPAPVQFTFEMVPHEEGNNLKSGPPPGIPPAGRIRIDKGSLVISSIEFEGRRDEGKDVFFGTNFPEPVTINLDTGETSHELTFDIPQGVYNRIEIILEIGGDNHTPMALEGKVRKGQSDQTPLRFEYNLRDRIRIRAEPGEQQNRIVLRKDKVTTARIMVDAGEVFQFINLHSLPGGIDSLQLTEGTVLISSQVNTGLFNSMASRLERSFRVIFE